MICILGHNHAPFIPPNPKRLQSFGTHGVCFLSSDLLSSARAVISWAVISWAVISWAVILLSSDLLVIWLSHARSVLQASLICFIILTPTHLSLVVPSNAIVKCQSTFSKSDWLAFRQFAFRQSGFRQYGSKPKIPPSQREGGWQHQQHATRRNVFC